MLDLGHQTTTEAADDKSDANTKPEQQQADARPPTGPPTVNLKPVALKDSDVEFPEGGIRAWLVVAGAVCNTFASFGLVNSWGVYQAYYEDTLLPGVSPSQIAWIGSIQYSFCFLPGLIVGRWLDRGHYRIPFFIATVTLVVAQLLVAQCTLYWQFILCQGLLVGISGGCVNGVAIGAVSHWFHRKRSRVYGIVATGSSLGGTVIPIATRKLIPLIGFRWTIRVVAAILLCVLTFANFTVRTRLPPQKVHGGLFNPKAFRSLPFTVYTFSTLVGFLGIYTPLTYLDSSAIDAGVDPDISFYMVSIANASSLFGRLTSGFLADRLGAMNVLIPYTLVTAVLTYAWPYATSTGTYAVVALLYGFTCGAYVALLLSPMAQMGETADIGRRIGMLTTILACGALAGPPISGAIRASTGSFKPVGAYAGTVILLCCAMMSLARWSLVGKIWGGRM